MNTWQLQEAETKFGELVEQTQLAPQTITVRGEPVAVVVSAQKYRTLVEPKQSLHEFLSTSPLSDPKLRFPRNPSTALRDINL